MEPADIPSERVILVNSREQGMEWSLVLASQEIPCALHYREGRWQLAVPQTEFGAAVDSLRQYCWENRRWMLHSKLVWASTGFKMEAAFWAMGLMLMHAWVNLRFPPFYQAGLMDSREVSEGEWWRLFTAVWLHVDLAHLMGNCAIGFVFLGFAMAQYRSSHAMLLAYLAGFMGNLASWALFPAPFRGVGASGMVMGALGLMAVHAASQLRHGYGGRKQMMRSALAGLMLFVLLGLDPSSNVVAHLAGFLSGLAFGALALLVPDRVAGKPWATSLAWAIFACLTIWPVVLAFTAGR